MSAIKQQRIYNEPTIQLQELLPTLLFYVGIGVAITILVVLLLLLLLMLKMNVLLGCSGRLLLLEHQRVHRMLGNQTARTM